MVQVKLYHCCNTCKYKANNIYSCDIPDKCYNGFSAYEPNEEMAKQEQQEREAAEAALNDNPACGARMDEPTT